MERNKFENLKLNTNIHTMEIHINSIVNTNIRGVTNIKHYIDEISGQVCQILKLNPSSYKGLEINSLEEHEHTVNEMIEILGITSYKYSRIDKKTDTYNKDDFDRYSKVNRIIILLVDLVYKLGNRYQSIDPLTLDNINIAAKNKYYEIEAYNKDVQSYGRDPATNRLEMRTLWLLHKDKNYKDIICEWQNRLDKAIEHFDALQKLQNEVLLKKYHQEIGVEVKSLWEFTRKYQNYIYTRKQLIYLYTSIGVKNAENSADNFKRNNRNIEFYNKTYLKKYVEMIKISDNIFLRSSTVLKNENIA